MLLQTDRVLIGEGIAFFEVVQGKRTFIGGPHWTYK